jgi:hypothetical protein
MINELLTVKIKNGRVSFGTIPDGLAIRVEDYDVKTTPLFLEEMTSLQQTLGLAKDEETGEWYKLEMYTDSVYDSTVFDQLDLPFQAEEA